MLHFVTKGLFVLLGAFIGIGSVHLTYQLKLLAFSGIVQGVTYVAGGLVGGLIFRALTPRLASAVHKALVKTEKDMERVPITDILFGTLGLMLGLVIAFLVTQPLSNLNIPFFGTSISVLLSIIIYIIIGVFTSRIAIKRKEDILLNLGRARIGGLDKHRNKDKSHRGKSLKILDTSAIIDGRIADIIRAGFIEGALVLPVFVLEELQHIADSPDSLRRERGRRGLDILAVIQKKLDVEVIISNEKYPDIAEVDSKLIKLAMDLDGKILTNDYNLNKVCEVQGVAVLNVNELANAVKPVVIPGEEMQVTVIKDGKEVNQGLAYLEDGTMIVVENGKRHIGKTIDVFVTSVLQTAAGKMIFVRPKI